MTRPRSICLGPSKKKDPLSPVFSVSWQLSLFKKDSVSRSDFEESDPDEWFWWVSLMIDHDESDSDESDSDEFDLDESESDLILMRWCK